MFASVDTIVTVAGGVLMAFITGGFAFAGVVVNVRAQKEPTKVEAPPDQVTKLLAELEDMTADRDRWRDLALQWVPRRRSSDLADFGDALDPEPDPS